MSFLSELNRRNVIRLGVFYIVASWLVLQVGQLLFEVLGVPEWALRMVLALLVLGFPITLVIAWIYEVTEDGIKKQSDIDREQSITHQTAKRLDIMTIVLLLGVAGLFLIDKMVHPTFSDGKPQEMTEAPESDPQRDGSDGVDSPAAISAIAVLPFEDFSQDKDQAHLATGIADTILHTLAQVEGLRVAARTSSFVLAEQNADIKTVGERLDVGVVLEGSVQKAGDRLRIIAQLIRVSDESHLWSETFDRPAGDIFAIQDEIAAAVLASLGKGEDAEASSTTTPEVYELFLKGRFLWQERTATAVQEAIGYLREAVNLDPDFAPAHADYALVLLMSVSGASFGTLEPAIERELEQARALDPNDPMTHGVTGLLRNYQGRESEALVALRRAIELDPNNPGFHTWLADVLRDGGNFTESGKHQERAVELDPLDLFARGRLASFRISFGGDPAGGLAMAKESVALAPGSHRAWTDLGLVQIGLNHHVEGLESLLKAIRINPQSPRPYVFIESELLRMGAGDAADRWLALLLSVDPNAKRYLTRYLLTGDADTALEMARKTVEEFPDRWVSHADLAKILSFMGRNEEALQSIRQADRIYASQEAVGQETRRESNFRSERIWVLRQVGEEEEAQRALEESMKALERVIQNGLMPALEASSRARFAAASGDTEAAVLYLGEFLDLDGEFYQPLYSPFFEAVRQHPEGQAILKEYRARKAAILAEVRETADPLILDPPDSIEGFR